MMRSIMVLALSMFACGSVSENDKIDAMPTDAAVDTSSPRCNPNAPFGAPMPLDTLNSAAYDEGGTLSPDELTIYFSSERAGPGSIGRLDVYVASRPSRTDAFGVPAVLAGVNTAVHEGSPSVTANGLFLYMYTHSTQTSYDIVLAQRASIAVDFGPPEPVPSLNLLGVADAGGFILPDHSAIYFHSNRNGINDDLYRAARNVGGSFDTATPVGVPAAHSEVAAVVTPDELTLFYASNAPGGDGGFDIYMAKRSTKSDGFGTPQHQVALSSTESEFPAWISADGCEIYLSRQVAGRSLDLFSARRGL